jgi:hypothetical protein
LDHEAVDANLPDDHGSVTSGRGSGSTIPNMNLIERTTAPVRRLLGRTGADTCFVCRKPILASEQRMRLRGDTVIHRSCATYRVRNGHSSHSRLGFPG